MAINRKEYNIVIGKAKPTYHVIFPKIYKRERKFISFTPIVNDLFFPRNMNKHIKVIDGKKYYYSTIRKKGTPTSKYIAPVKSIYKTKRQKKVCKK